MIRTLIIDGSWVAFRAFNVGGHDACVEAMTRAVFYLDRFHRPAETIVVWDERGRNIRHTINEGYKGNRPPWPDEYCVARDALANSILPALGVTQAYSADQVWLEGEVISQGEGDDVAATIATSRPGPHLMIAADKDWLQLLEPGANIGICREVQTGAPVITSENVKELTGFTAFQWSDFLTIAGDPTDGISGLPRIAKKRATEMIAAVEPLSILDHALEDDFAPLLAACDERDPSSSQWFTVAAQNIELLRECWELVRLRTSIGIVERAGCADFIAAACELQNLELSEALAAELREAEKTRELLESCPL
jgi:5'-3' exonuclease